MTANGSSSSADGRPELDRLDLVASQRLPPIPLALLDGREADLLAPIRFLQPGERPGSVPDTVPRDTVSQDAAPRAALAAALGDANEAYGNSRARVLAEKLADPRTRVVVTGQQAGIYGGPLLALTKMAAALRAEARHGRWGVIADGFYADLSGSGTPPGPLRSHVGLDMKQFIGELSLAYRLWESPDGFVDVYGGLRYNDLQ